MFSTYVGKLNRGMAAYRGTLPHHQSHRSTSLIDVRTQRESTIRLALVFVELLYLERRK
jgi:hypothetical protein